MSWGIWNTTPVWLVTQRVLCIKIKEQLITKALPLATLCFVDIYFHIFCLFHIICSFYIFLLHVLLLMLHANVSAFVLCQNNWFTFWSRHTDKIRLQNWAFFKTKSIWNLLFHVKMISKGNLHPDWYLSW